METLNNKHNVIIMLPSVSNNDTNYTIPALMKLKNILIYKRIFEHNIMQKCFILLALSNG